MKISEMIKELQEILKKEGDLDLVDEKFNSVDGITIQKPYSRLSQLYFLQNTIAVFNTL